MDRPWKQAERAVARILGGRRHWANSGRAVDVESGGFVCQVKHRARCSLAMLEALALEAERQGTQRQKVGVVAVKRRAGAGRATPWLFVLTEAAWRALHRAAGLRTGPAPREEAH